MHGSIVCRWTRGPDSHPWCARLLGLDEKCGFRREFIKGIYDYTYTSRYAGSKTVLIFYAVPPGIYQVYDNINRSRGRKYFVRVTDEGEIVEIERDDVLECLRKLNSE